MTDRADADPDERIAVRDGSTIVLITGATRGIGRETARQLAAQGATVLLGSRDARRGEAVAEALSADGDVRPITLDVTDDATVDAAARRVDEEFGRLDVLINNAGVIAERPGPAAAAQVADLRATYETNVFGVVRVTNAFLPLLHRSDAPRIVNLSSFLGSLGRTSTDAPDQRIPMLLAYRTSKTALNALTVQYGLELRDTAIRVDSVDPGYVSTDLNRHTGTRSVEDGAAVVVAVATAPAKGSSGGFLDEHGPVPW